MTNLPEHAGTPEMRAGDADRDRVAQVHAALTAPDVSTATARKWTVTHKVATVTAAVDGTLAMKLDGAVIRPGQGLHLAALLGTTDARIENQSHCGTAPSCRNPRPVGP